MTTYFDPDIRLNLPGKFTLYYFLCTKMGIDLQSLKYYAGKQLSRDITCIECQCQPNEMDEYCNTLVCSYPKIRELKYLHPEATHIPPLLFSRLEKINISGTKIEKLPSKSNIKHIDASNTKVDPHDLIRNYGQLEYCKTGFLECDPLHEEHPRRVYENANEILLVRLHLFK